MKKQLPRPVPTAIHRATMRLSRLFPFMAAWRDQAWAFMSRRPHRSFRVTRRRDYARSLQLPGYWKFTGLAWRMLWTNKKLFGWLLAIYTILTIVLVGMTSQAMYTGASSAIGEANTSIWSSFNFGSLGQAGLVLMTALSGSLNGNEDPARNVYAVLLVLMTWLTTVWLLRALMAGQKPRLRDGLYNAGAPILPTFLLVIVLTIQLLPLALVAFGYSAASTTGLLEGGVEAMLFWVAAALVAVLSLFWATSTFIALVIITLPGMYPLRALSTAGDVVVGRRVRILLRLLWVLLLLAVTWVVIMIPLILFDGWLKSVAPAIAWLPLVPVALLLLGSVSVVMLAAYVYMLYRRIVEDDAAPATN